MTFLLSSQNVAEYLVEQALCTQEEQALSHIELKFAKNFNLLLSLPTGRRLLVKQERLNQNGKTVGEFFNEWRVQELLTKFPELSHTRHLFPEGVHFNENDSVVVFNYLDDYRDLADFYAKEKVFPTEIAGSLGTSLAIIHRSTWERQEYRDFFAQNREVVTTDQSPNFVRGLGRVGPEVFGLVPADALKFFSLYQRYDSLEQAIAELANAFTPCCLTHNDLKLNNILLHNDWEQALVKTELSSTIRLIDWERCTWGDPAFDLGTIIASYLQIWLTSLVVSQSIEIEVALRLAMTPLEKLQPSIAALTSAYCEHFPEILQRPRFLQQVVQFSGLALIHQIQATLQYLRFFGNTGICMLQVAKSLLCRPEKSIPTVFGTTETELTRYSRPSNYDAIT